MSGKEFERRKLTGTLASGSVTAAVASLAEPDLNPKKKSRLLAQMTLNPDGTDFTCEASSMFFKVPKSVFVPHPINDGLKRKKMPDTSVIPKSLLDLGWMRWFYFLKGLEQNWKCIGFSRIFEKPENKIAYSNCPSDIHFLKFLIFFLKFHGILYVAAYFNSLRLQEKNWTVCFISPQATAGGKKQGSNTIMSTSFTLKFWSNKIIDAHLMINPFTVFYWRSVESCSFNFSGGGNLRWNRGLFILF